MKMNDVPEFMAPYIIINGDNHVKVADAISNHYSANVTHCDEDNCSVINAPSGSALEKAFCMEEETMQEALEELRAAYPDIQFNEEDIEF